MATRRLLYFTAEENFLYAASGAALELEMKFAAGDPGVRHFREYLRHKRGALFGVMADLVGEDFHEDQIPWLRGSDRQAVVRRRLAQRYRDNRLAAAISLGRVAKGERRYERLLLACLANAEQLAPWLDAVAESGARLAGIYSPPLLAPALATRLGFKDRCITVSVNRAGLRQSFVADGRLRFARLERAPEMAPQALALFVRSETIRLAQYLATLRALPRDAVPVNVVVVAPSGQRDEFARALASDERLTFHTLDVHEASRRTGLRRVPEGTAAEALYVYLAAKKPPREQFANQDDQRGYQVWQLKRAIVAAGALGLVACALHAGIQGVSSEDLRERATAEAREARATAEAYQRLTAAFPVTETSAENLKLAVTEFQRIARLTASPESAFLHVSRVLERFSQLELDAIDWSVGALSRSSDKAATPPRAEGKGGDVAVRLEITGRVHATRRADYRAITAHVQQFAGALGVSGYELVRTRLPFDFTSEGTLSGDSNSTRDSAEAPRFNVVLVRRLP